MSEQEILTGMVPQLEAQAVSWEARAKNCSGSHPDESAGCMVISKRYRAEVDAACAGADALDQVAQLQADLQAANEQLATARAAWPATPDDSLKFIFGIMPWTSRGYATILRGKGVEIPNKCEMEQAHAIHWMLGHYLKHGPDNWREFAGEEVKATLAAMKEVADAAMPIAEGKG